MSRNTRKPNTVHEFGSDELFDKDISGLHKVVQPQKILSKNVRYLPPSICQAPYMINFMIEAFADLIMSPEAMSKLDRNEVFLEVINYVVDITKNIDGEDKVKAEEAEQLLGSAFGSKAAINYLIPVMRQCFPDIDIYTATNECFVECFNVIFSDMFSTKPE